MGFQVQEHNLISDRDAEFCAGQFIWTGFDYIGEPTPYSTKNSYFGQIDTAGFLKDSAYVYKAVWTDSRKDPFVHIFPYWDFNEGEMIDVLVTTNCFEAKLYFNGEELASKVFGERPMQLTMKKTLPYSKGELVAIAYDENGNELARDVQRSFSETAEIRLLPDRQSIACGSEELIFVEISAYDSDGNFVANGRDRVFVDVSGAGRLVGLDNGDSTDYEQYKGTSRRLFSGRLLAMIAPVEKAGDIIVRVTSPGLPEKTLTLRADASKAIEGISFTARNTERRLDCDEKENDISPRRIELRADETVFGPERKKLRINYKVLPESSPYKDVEFRIATYDGIDCGYARITQKDENSVTVEALGDGEFYLRAVSRCGTKKIRLISMLRLSAKGLGSALSDPYSFVTGGLYTISGGNVTNGIQHGAGISEGGGWVGYENVDFGEVGSDTITIPLFANYATPVGIKVYDGVPGEGGELIGDFVYDLKPIWLTYQAMTYKLNRLLRGIHTIVLASDVSYNIQGLVFEKRAKETAELTAVHAESIYGDRFKRSDDEITGIGNNVMISFGTFDFCDKAPMRIYIKGRSALPVNSIHLQFTEENAEQKRILCEFEQADDYTERAFTIEGISGKVGFSMIFLPGSDFDLRSVRFE